MEEASGGGEGKGELWQVMEPAFIALALAIVLQCVILESDASGSIILTSTPPSAAIFIALRIVSDGVKYGDTIYIW